jgi:hypothetical protein
MPGARPGSGNGCADKARVENWGNDQGILGYGLAHVSRVYVVASVKAD